MIGYILILVHILLCVVTGALCKRASEKEWWLFTALCCIPYVGPLLIIYLYVMYKSSNSSNNDDSYKDVN